MYPDQPRDRDLYGRTISPDEIYMRYLTGHPKRHRLLRRGDAACGLSGIASNAEETTFPT
jgi:hypothetical protein